jgi:hypothetical protein
MSIVRVGSTTTYAENWDAIFGGRKATKQATKQAAKKRAKKPKATK